MKKLWIENIDNPCRMFQVEQPNNDFIDKSTDMVEWYNSIHILDWFLRRDRITPLFYAEAGAQLQNFAGMSQEKKEIACFLFLIPYSLRIQMVTDEEDRLNWDILLMRSKEHRVECVERLRKHTGGYMRTGMLTLEQCQQFFVDVSEMLYRYEESNIPEFRDFINKSTGEFETKDYFSDQLSSELINIYNGESWE